MEGFGVLEEVGLADDLGLFWFEHFAELLDCGSFLLASEHAFYNSHQSFAILRPYFL